MSSADWQNNLKNCLGPALAAYSKGIEKEAQAEVDKLELGLKVPNFSAPKLSAEIAAATSYTSNAGGGGAVAGGVTGAAIGTAIVPGVGTVIGGILGLIAGGAAEEEVRGGTVSPDREMSLENVRETARGLRPALKEEAKKYLDRVEKAIATVGGKIRTGEDDVVEQLNKLFGV